MNLVTGTTALSKDAVEMEYIHDCCDWQFLSPLPGQAGRSLKDVPIDHEEGWATLRVTHQLPLSLFSCILEPAISLHKGRWDLAIGCLGPSRKHIHMYNDEVSSPSDL